MSAANVLERAANEELSKHGITYRQVQVLGALAMFGEQTQAVLADRLLVESSTLVRILDRMERDGWVERVPSPTDRRAKLVRETEKVEPVWRKIRACGDRIRKRAAEGLEDWELAAVGSVLEKVCGNFTRE